MKLSEYIWFLKYRNSILRRQVESYQNGNAFNSLRDDYEAIIHKKNIQIKMHERDVAKVHDKAVPANNSLAERLARVFKRKQKQMMVFRSRDNFEYVCDSLGILYTLKFEEGNLYNRVTDIFDRKRYRKKKKKKEEADVSV